MLPLFAGRPLLGPIYVQVDRFLPPDLPLLLIVPALAIDLLMRRFGTRARLALSRDPRRRVRRGLRRRAVAVCGFPGDRRGPRNWIFGTPPHGLHGVARRSRRAGTSSIRPTTSSSGSRSRSCSRSCPRGADCGGATGCRECSDDASMQLAARALSACHAAAHGRPVNMSKGRARRRSSPRSRSSRWRMSAVPIRSSRATRVRIRCAVVEEALSSQLSAVSKNIEIPIGRLGSQCF